MLNDFVSCLVQLKTVISCQFLRPLAQHKRLLILRWQLVRQFGHCLDEEACVGTERLRAALFDLLRKQLRLEAIFALSYLDVRRSRRNRAPRRRVRVRVLMVVLLLVMLDFVQTSILHEGDPGPAPK